MDATLKQAWTNYSECGTIYIDKIKPFEFDDSADNTSILDEGIPIIKSITHFGYGISLFTVILSLLIFVCIK